MAVITKKVDPPPAYMEAVEEIMKTYKSLPPRPSIEQLEAAISVVNSVTSEQQLRLEEISNQLAPQEVPPDLFSILQQVRKTMVLLQSHEQSKEALLLIELDKFHHTFDDLIQRASQVISGGTQMDIKNNFEYPSGKSEKGEGVIGDEVKHEDHVIKKSEDDEEAKDGNFEGLVKTSSTKLPDFSLGMCYFFFIFHNSIK